MYLIEPIERYLRRRLTEVNRRRFDRAKEFVERSKRSGGREAAHRADARWLKFLCSRPAIQRDIWPQDADFLNHFAMVFGLPPGEKRKFVGLSLLGRLWRASSFHELSDGPPELVARLTRVSGWEHVERCLSNGSGLILLPYHSQFSRFFQLYLRYHGSDGLELGLRKSELEQRGFRTPAAKRLELARQMHAAKRQLARGGIVFNAADARQNLDYSRTIEFFGRRRQIAAGFAELALLTGARVIPVACRFSVRGFFVLDFGVPFLLPGPQASHDEGVASLVAQYGDFLRDEWRRYPWNLQWPHLQYYCLLPEIEPGAGGEKPAAPNYWEASVTEGPPTLAG